MSDRRLSRRDFARSALTGVAAAAVSGDAEGADKPAVEARRPAADRRAESLEDLLLEAIRLRYPDPRLRPEVLREIRRDVASDLERSRTLSSYPLQNSDEPGFVFAAYRGDAIR